MYDDALIILTTDNGGPGEWEGHGTGCTRGVGSSVNACPSLHTLAPALHSPAAHAMF